MSVKTVRKDNELLSKGGLTERIHITSCTTFTVTQIMIICDIS